MSSERAKVIPLRRKARCPICGRQTDPEHRPFCSRHCSNVDLARWFGSTYKVETGEQPVTTPSPGDDEG